MSTLLAELSTRAHLLPPEEPAQLAEGFLESMKEALPQELKAAWDTEILKRIGEYDRGKAVLSPASDVFAEARRLTQ